jgi:hypothetical protein
VTSLSRPFQVVLAVFALLVALWFVALRAHNSGSSESNSGSSASQPAKPATHRRSPAESGAQKRTGHGTAAQSTASHASTGQAGGAQAGAAHASTGQTGSVEHTATAAKGAAKQASSTSSAPAKQREVEHELSQQRTVLILFWNPRAAEDRAVRNELPAVQRKLRKKIALHYASAKQVGEFGTVTHAVQVTQTPTLLIVNPKGQTTTRTGLIDAFAIEQAISEAGKASSKAGK